jgi:hypothetical protein
MFGLVYACDMDTYAGSLPPAADYPVPGNLGGDAALPVWFACSVDGAEGDEAFTGEAVGWTSATDVAWLVVGPDVQTVQALVSAMREAASS